MENSSPRVNLPVQELMPDHRLFCCTLERIQKIVKLNSAVFCKQDQCGSREKMSIVIFPDDPVHFRNYFRFLNRP